MQLGTEGACMSKVLAQKFVWLHLLVKFGKRAGEIADTHIPQPWESALETSQS